ncbi:MAG: type III polyketide synthase [Candidatus Sericytochromatia bacterium]
MSSKIINVSTLVPQYSFSQNEIFDSFNQTFKNDEKLKAIFLNSGISKRHSVLDSPAKYFYLDKRTTKQRNDIYFKESMDICSKAIEKCLNDSKLKAQDIDELIIVSCTGVNIPGLDILLAKKFEMKNNLQRTNILFMGCYAAFPALRKAFEYTSLNKNKKSLVVCVELCTLHFQYNDSLESVVSTSLFADGCSVALIENNDNNSQLFPQIIDSHVHTAYNTTEHMAFNLTDEGFEMSLSSYVPSILKSNIDTFVSDILSRNNLTKTDINHWLIHPGGIKILNYLQEELNLNDNDLIYSRKVLNDYGNMSSSTILFVLDELIKSNNVKNGDRALMMAFGPGLTMESLLIEWK